MKANISYKDSLFSSFLGEPWRLVEIYNAVQGTDYPLDTPVEINTLTDVLWKDQLNDLSFILNGQMVILIEHQSTINENMALRMLLYVARIYEKLLQEKAIYKRKRISIPTPKFIVFYNGRENCPEHYKQNLSQSFLVSEKQPMLELYVDVYNINYQKSPQIIEKSQSLKEYSLFVHQVNIGLNNGFPFGEAVMQAIRYCITHNIMKEYLHQNGSEVENMLFTEWNNETALEVWKEEALEDMQEEMQRQQEEMQRRQEEMQRQQEEMQRQIQQQQKEMQNDIQKQLNKAKKEEQARERRSILALSDLLSPEVLAEKFELPLEYIQKIQQEALTTAKDEKPNQ